MKKVILALASLGMAAMFTACDDSSSGDSGKLVSCDINVSMSAGQFSGERHMCGEAASTSQLASQVDAMCNASSVEGYAAMGMNIDLKVGSGCPSGYVKTCPDGEATLYLYDETLTCEKMKMSDIIN